MKRLLAIAAFCLSLASCVGYPRPYLTTVKGRASLDDNQPIRIQAGILKTCDTVNGETEDLKNLKETTTDKDGRYSMMIFGLTWHYKNFMTMAQCSSHIQRFVCRPHCRKADAIDIEMLGK